MQKKNTNKNKNKKRKNFFFNFYCILFYLRNEYCLLALNPVKQIVFFSVNLVTVFLLLFLLLLLMVYYHLQHFIICFTCFNTSPNTSKVVIAFIERNKNEQTDKRKKFSKNLYNFCLNKTVKQIYSFWYLLIKFLNLTLAYI